MTKTTKILSLLSSPLLLLLLFAINPVEVYGQPQAQTPPPDCGPVFINVVLTAASAATISIPGTGANAFDNRTQACQSWTLMYQATATAGAITSIALQAATGATVPGAFANWSGTVSTGINPNTNATNGITTFTTGCASAMSCTTPDSWLLILITRNTFVGTINGVLYGYRSGYPGSSGGTGGCPGTVATPCVVDGVTAAGSPPTTPPVLVAGQDGTNLQTIKTDTNGQTIPANASSVDADAVSNTEATSTGAAGGILYPRIFNRVFNGTTWDRMRGDTTGVPTANASSADADAVSNTQNTNTTVAGAAIIYPRLFPHVFNGTTWDRLPGNTTGIPPANASFNLAADPGATAQLTPSSAGGTRLFDSMALYMTDGTANLRMLRGNQTGLMLSNTSSNVTDGLGPSLPGYTLLDQTQFIFFRGIPYGFNGTTYDRQHLASLANFPASVGGGTTVSAGAQIFEKGGRLEVISSPTAGTQASASAAANATARHVADCISWSGVSTAASAATNVLLVLRDGATGAGTIIHEFNIASVTGAASGVQTILPFSLCGLNIVGTTNTAMTLEFSAGVANVQESVNLTFYNVQ